jgi:hypothetical protein
LLENSITFFFSFLCTSDLYNIAFFFSYPFQSFSTNTLECIIYRNKNFLESQQALSWSNLHSCFTCGLSFDSWFPTWFAKKGRLKILHQKFIALKSGVGRCEETIHFITLDYMQKFEKLIKCTTLLSLCKSICLVNFFSHSFCLFKKFNFLSSNWKMQNKVWHFKGWWDFPSLTLFFLQELFSILKIAIQRLKIVLFFLNLTPRA